MIRNNFFFYLFVVFVLISSAQASLLRKRHVGQATFYDVGLGACGKQNNNHQFVAALNTAQFGTFANPNNSPNCGRRARVRGPNGSVTVTIVDSCPTCKKGDIDLSPSAFAKIASLNDGRVPISWSFEKAKPKKPKKKSKKKSKHH